MIERYDVNETWAHSGIIKAGDFCFLGYCVGNVGVINIPDLQRVAKLSLVSATSIVEGGAHDVTLRSTSSVK